ncbi:GH92 family glycosyl hydrolase [Actinoallomurus sp. NPDC052308]|uniref:GH92 family glycosyl hydrolase n=1 Tax=Actinoallomurus sp. NPDC052308 TaxID=3155530 RepID=UPI003449E296
MSPARAAEAPAGLVDDPVGLVNPFLGTGKGGEVVGPVDMFPGASMPFGMLTWSPDTPTRPAGGGYDYDDSSTLGFSLTHASGAGCNIFGDLPILPTTGAIGSDPAKTTEPFRHSDEQARPGYYATRLGTDGAIGAKLAVTTRTGIGRFDYPATTQADLLFKVGDSQGGNTAATVDITGDDQISGSVSGGHFCGHQDTHIVYFAATFDRPFTSYGTWNGTTVTPGARTAAVRGAQRAPQTPSGATNAPAGVEAKGPQNRTQAAGSSGPKAGAWVGFDTTQNGQVGMKVAISYVSAANALANLKAENPGWDVTAVANQAETAWRRLLSRIQVGGGTHDQQVEFYTALYHALLVPSVFSDANGQYLGFDGKVHNVAPGRAQYANYSGWDIYRSEVPLLAMLAPDQTSQMMQSLVNDAAEGGWLPKWPVAGAYTGVMSGDPADAMIAEAYAFGARDFDTKAALAAMIKGATVPQSKEQYGQGYYEERPGLADYLKRGYVPNTPVGDNNLANNGASITLEYATADFSIARFADAIGDHATARRFLDRSQNWTNIFNVDSGYFQPRDSDGAFPGGNPVTAGMLNFGQSGFQEGNAAQYAWMVPQNPHGLITAMGGKGKVDRRLDEFFTRLNVGPNQPYYWAGNEVDILAPWLYDYTGKPYKTQDLVHRLLTTVYSNTPGGEPGNDDLGAMSSWFVWAALGMYPQTPGTSVLALGAPLFSTVRMNLGGRTVTISAPGASSTTYVHALSVNGRPWSRAWLPGSLLAGGGPGHVALDFRLADKPDTRWGAAPGDEPPSYSAGALRFPPGLTPTEIETDPATTTVTAGATTKSTLTFTIGAGARPARAPRVGSITWKASPPSGVTISPASGTLPVSADGTATTTVTISAAANVTQGFETIPITVTAGPSVALPRLSLPVTVIGPGDTATTCTTLGTTKTDCGLSQIEENGDGVTSPVTVGGMSGRTTVPVTSGQYMYFRVDPRIASHQHTTATFTITYYDSGTESWSLQYDADGGGAFTRALSVTNQNTGTWKTATVTVQDAGFAGRENGSTDFRIGSSAPITIHSVRTKISGPNVLPVDLCPGSPTSGSGASR